MTKPKVALKREAYHCHHASRLFLVETSSHKSLVPPKVMTRDLVGTLRLAESMCLEEDAIISLMQWIIILW